MLKHDMTKRGAGLKNDHENSVQKEYAHLAQKYDDKWSFYVEATLQKTLKKIELHSGEHLLDIGCGTGALLAAIEKRYPDAVLAGVDPTQEMLDIAGNRLSKKVHIKRSWAERLPFDTETFDVIVFCSVFHYIREPLLALKEVVRVLKPTGRVVITDWCDDYITCQICDLFLRVFNKAHFKTYRKKEFYQLLSSSGFFDDIEINGYKVNWFWGMMTATACKKSNVKR
ncbi:MAG TPA: methyltransferase domain-containing protein [Gammaproteobacteria bacterium]|nr:methyltransferase domain-containing protein [Gammaproteobacteria bacterium]